jgi:hypothetical protein
MGYAAANISHWLPAHQPTGCYVPPFSLAFLHVAPLLLFDIRGSFWPEMSTL